MSTMYKYLKSKRLIFELFKLIIFVILFNKESVFITIDKIPLIIINFVVLINLFDFFCLQNSYGASRLKE